MWKNQLLIKIKAMKYYINKTTGEPLAVIDDLIELTFANSHNFEVIYLSIFPERWLGNGIITHAISHSELKNFKIISKDLFFEKCPDFGQFRHKNTKQKIQFIEYAIPIRKESFGI